MARTAPLAIAALLAAACGGSPGKPAAPEYAWRLPAGFPAPRVPAANPMSEEKVELGRHLFYDPRLSLSESRACASCHHRASAFAGNGTRGAGLTGPTRRNVPSLGNAVYVPAYTWADPGVTSIEDVIRPTLADPNEFGAAGEEATIAARLQADPRYPPMFARAFPEEPIGFETAAKAIAAFVRTLLTGDSPWDRYQRGDPTAMSDAAKAGMDLFFSERLECFHCHAGFTLASAVTHAGLPVAEAAFENTGLYDVDGAGAYPAEDPGLVEVTGLAADMGRFKAPSLRNVALTGPYMHDGSVATLGDVLDHYAAGGRSALATGHPSPLRSTTLVPFTLTAQERSDLLAFLESLTDDAFLSDPRFADPFAP